MAPLAFPENWTLACADPLLPTNEAEAGELVRESESVGVALVPCGGGTRLQTGYPPAADRPWRLLSSYHLSRITDHQPADMTVTCEPGVTLVQLQALLAGSRQYLSLDISFPGETTIGGIVASAASGFWRPLNGAPRDLVIGIRAVLTGGTAIRGGGKVVKNVAGYDLCKLFTGSWGSLGFLTEITLKVRTGSDVTRVICWPAATLAAAAQAGHAILQANLAVGFTAATNELTGMPTLLVGMMGTVARVVWQTEQFAGLARELGIQDDYASVSEEEFAGLVDSQGRRGACFAGRLSALPSELPALAERFGAMKLAVTAHSATGLLSFAGQDPAQFPEVRTLVDSTGRRCLWQVAAAELPGMDNIKLWGVPGAERSLNRALKQQLDPRNTFSPGRFFDQL